MGLRWVARPCLTVAARLRRKHRAYTVPSEYFVFPTERLRFAPLLLRAVPERLRGAKSVPPSAAPPRTSW